jgi:hypothetical protein
MSHPSGDFKNTWQEENSTTHPIISTNIQITYYED